MYMSEKGSDGTFCNKFLTSSILLFDWV